MLDGKQAALQWAGQTASNKNTALLNIDFWQEQGQPAYNKTANAKARQEHKENLRK